MIQVKEFILELFRFKGRVNRAHYAGILILLISIPFVISMIVTFSSVVSQNPSPSLSEILSDNTHLGYENIAFNIFLCYFILVFVLLTFNAIKRILFNLISQE